MLGIENYPIAAAAIALLASRRLLTAVISQQRIDSIRRQYFDKENRGADDAQHSRLVWGLLIVWAIIVLTVVATSGLHVASLEGMVQSILNTVSGSAESPHTADQNASQDRMLSARLLTATKWAAVAVSLRAARFYGPTLVKSLHIWWGKGQSPKKKS